MPGRERLHGVTCGDAASFVTADPFDESVKLTVKLPEFPPRCASVVMNVSERCQVLVARTLPGAAVWCHFGVKPSKSAGAALSCSG